MSIIGWQFAVDGLPLAVFALAGGGFQRNLSGFAFPLSGLLAKLNFYALGGTGKVEAGTGNCKLPTANRKL